MDTTARWFPLNGKMHARRPPRPNEPESRIVGYCGFSPAATSGITTFDLAVDQIPDGDVCRTCLLNVAMQSVDEEPVEHALERDYLPYDGTVRL